MGSNWAHFVVFPEPFIRQISGTLLSNVNKDFLKRPELMERLSYALVFTRNVKLRGNIFSSILLLASESQDFKRYGILFQILKPLTCFNGQACLGCQEAYSF